MKAYTRRPNVRRASVRDGCPYTGLCFPICSICSRCFFRYKNDNVRHFEKKKKWVITTARRRACHQRCIQMEPFHILASRQISKWAIRHLYKDPAYIQLQQLLPMKKGNIEIIYLNVELMALGVIWVVDEVSFILDTIANAFIFRAVVEHLVLGARIPSVNHHTPFTGRVESLIRPFAFSQSFIINLNKEINVWNYLEKLKSNYFAL